MSDYTSAEIHAAVDALREAGKFEDWDEYQWEADQGRAEPLVIRGEEVEVKVIEADTGGEGHGEACHIVIQVGDQLFRQDGSYYSYDGTTWDGNLYEVEAIQRPVTFYERKG